jgi:hypothetical protein
MRGATAARAWCAGTALLAHVQDSMAGAADAAAAHGLGRRPAQGAGVGGVSAGGASAGGASAGGASAGGGVAGGRGRLRQERRFTDKVVERLRAAVASGQEVASSVAVHSLRHESTAVRWGRKGV